MICWSPSSCFWSILTGTTIDTDPELLHHHIRPLHTKHILIKIIFYRIFQRNNFKLLPPPAFGHGVATFDFFLYFNLPSSQICTILPTSFVTAPSQISLPLNLQLALMVVARKNRVMARVTSYVTNINFLKLQTKLYPNYKMWRWLFHSIYELLHLF